MRIAIVTATGLVGASARYRAVQFVEHLARDHEVQLLLPSDGVRESHGGAVERVRYFGGHAACYAVRLRELHRVLPRFDGVLVQRGAYPMGPGAVVGPIVRFDGQVVFDLDDAVFATSPDLARRGRATRWLYGPQQAARLVARADAVVVSTDAVGDCLPGARRPDAVLPTIPDPARCELAVHAERRPVLIGWAGNAGNLSYLDAIAPALAALRERGAAELEVVSSRPWPGSTRFVPWRLEQEAGVFSRHDIGIMPLPDTPYTRAKAGFKLLQYMAAGLPVVASPVGANVEIVERSQAGMLASSPAEWERALGRLAGDVELRAELGRRGRSWIEREADVADQASVLRGLLECR
jgi:glycosyltransferase involved in cell wall biosynthesis